MIRIASHAVKEVSDWFVYNKRHLDNVVELNIEILPTRCILVYNVFVRWYTNNNIKVEFNEVAETVRP